MGIKTGLKLLDYETSERESSVRCMQWCKGKVHPCTGSEALYRPNSP